MIKSLALTINSFDCSELLERTLTPIRSQVDYIVSVIQNHSYHKEPIDKEDVDRLQYLKKIKLIDEIITFNPNYTKPPREIECDKRNFGIAYVRSLGCSHVLNVDEDEGYSTEQFQYAKEKINKENYLITYWPYVNYYKDLDHYLVYPFIPYVNGIHSTKLRYTFNSQEVKLPTDPTRRISNPFNLIPSYVFKEDEIRMAHLSWVRTDISKKIRNWSANKYFTKDLYDKAIERYNNWKEGDDAIQLFNVPNNSVKVKRLETRIHDI